jgi:hypothetical protein
MTHTPRIFTALELETIDSLLSRLDTAIRSGRAVSDLVDIDSPAAAVADASADLQTSLLNSIAAVIFPADFLAVTRHGTDKPEPPRVA